ncbi:amino acid ABC transporter permease [Paraburkholderia sp. CNPSo 3281]|uniref:amino acid ABC transporter permease n=1 Tax=Paraburkholderia sp. CNPSo 3281 TaxID=2940933 RepID=UPI0020B6E6A5|nr:amino acid ABC transporter permease [Paraburkholderia sp. CNPSo 3281]MCP3721003.1 amino acid ABC transporter permease [Paraburkholderia sp. CNPSo 3281]
MTTVTSPLTQSVDSTGLSPAPHSRAWATISLVSALAVLAAVVSLGGAAVNHSGGDEAVHWIGIGLNTAGVIACAVVLWYAGRALRASLRSSGEASRGDTLASRASAEIARQDAFISFGLLFAVAISVALVLLVTMNNASIQKTFLRWDLMKESGLDVMKAFGLNIWLAVVSECFVLVFGLVLAVARMIPGRAGQPVRLMAIAYIDIMRAVPAIIVVYLVGFGLPIAKIPVLSDLPPEWFAIIALTLTYSAYMAEVYRSGIESIHPSQWSATRSLGFSYGQTLRFVILPQAVRRVIPPLLSAFIGLQKDTSLVNIIGTMDAFNQAKFYASSSFNLSSVTVVAIFFVIFTIPQARFVDWMLARGNTFREKR